MYWLIVEMTMKSKETSRGLNFIASVTSSIYIIGNTRVEHSQSAAITSVSPQHVRRDCELRGSW
jgi:hypothetical protein